METVKKVLKYLFLSVVLLSCLYPIFWIVMTSFKTTDEIFLNPFSLPETLFIQNYVDAVSRYNVWQYFVNSFIVTAVTITLVCILSATFAYATARMRWKLSGTAYIFIVMGMFIPVQIVLLPLSQMLAKLELTNTLLGLIIPYTAFGLPMGCVMFYAYIRKLPIEVEESAALDGASIYVIFFRIILPLIKPAFAMVAIYTLIITWNEFTMASVLITKDAVKTLPLGLVAFQGKFSTNFGAMSAALTIASIPTVILYLIFNKPFENAISTSAAVKG